MTLFGKIKEAYRQCILKKLREQNPPRYVVEQPGDLLHIPPDRLGACLDELRVAIETVRDLQNKGTMGGKSAAVVMKRFIWIDDGKQDQNIRVKGR